MVPFAPRNRLIPFKNNETGELYVDALLGNATLIISVVSLIVFVQGEDPAFTLFIGALCGIAGIFFSIMGFVEAFREGSRTRGFIAAGSMLFAGGGFALIVRLIMVLVFHMSPLEIFG
jgi:hypothetical protein